MQQDTFRLTAAPTGMCSASYLRPKHVNKISDCRIAEGYVSVVLIKNQWWSSNFNRITNHAPLSARAGCETTVMRVMWRHRSSTYTQQVKKRLSSHVKTNLSYQRLAVLMSSQYKVSGPANHEVKCKMFEINLEIIMLLIFVDKIKVY